MFSSPLDGNGREILSQVYRSIYASPKGSTIRLVVWNFADPAITTALIAAKKRGVRVQVVVAESVKNKQWYRIRDALSANPNDRSFAVRCHNACRTDRFVMHAKIFLFSKAGQRRHVSMFGSTNLTKAAGNRQWNDQVTTANEGLYDFFVQTFKEYAADRAVSTGNDIYDGGRYRVVLFPVPETNPVAEALEKVKCHPPEGQRWRQAPDGRPDRDRRLVRRVRPAHRPPGPPALGQRLRPAHRHHARRPQDQPGAEAALRARPGADPAGDDRQEQGPASPSATCT